MPTNLQYIPKPGNSTKMSAYQWDGSLNKTNFPAWLAGNCEVFVDFETNQNKLLLWRNDGYLEALPNDYICLYQGGELFHLAPNIFNKCYQAAT